MELTSFSFLLFFAALSILYFFIPHKYQWTVLLVFSYGFYYLISGRLPFFMIPATVVTYFGTKFIYNIQQKSDAYLKENKQSLSKDNRKAYKKTTEKKKRLILATALILNFGMLSVFKYTDFVISNFISIANLFNFSLSKPVLNLLLPLGISFYTFQSAGYLIDVYRKQAVPEKNFLKTALFLAYFPQIIEGPIGRFKDLAAQLFEGHSFSFDRFKRNVFLILWGFLKKLVIADNLAIMVNSISEGYAEYDGFQIIIGLLFYGIQLYADFSGYMDIVTGFSGILEIRLAPNFKRPYLSVSLAEFWRRWHMSLCTWFRDYLFYPVFMSKFSMNIGKKLRAKGKKKAAKNIPTFLAMAVVWFTTGLWHGACWTEIVWGLANGLIMIFSLQFEDTYKLINKKLHINTESGGWKFFRIIRTYILITLLNFICTFKTLPDALKSFAIALNNPLPHGFSPAYLFPVLAGNGIVVLGVMLLSCFALLAVSLYEEKGNSLIEKICSKHWLAQGLVMLVMFFVSLLFAGHAEDMTGGFMYAQF